MSDAGTPEDWSPAQAAVFTRTYRFMLENQRAFRHPGAPILAEEHWHTVCFNAAWAAADFMEHESITVMGDDDSVFAASSMRLDS